MHFYIFGTGMLLAFSGWVLSVYFYGVYRGWINHNQWWIPTFCHMEKRTCSSIVDTPYGRILRYPNAAYGIVFMPVYGFTILLAGINRIPTFIPLLGGVTTVILAIYLTYGLIKLKVVCPVCLIVHIINLIIFLLLLISYFFD